MKYLILFIASIACGCSSYHKDLSFTDANKIFHVGMSQKEVESTFGKPELVSDYAGPISWIYSPEHLNDKSGPGEYIGFIIDFREGRTTAIKPYSTIVGHPSILPPSQNQ
jgi:hypothetical protein